MSHSSPTKREAFERHLQAQINRADDLQRELDKLRNSNEALVRERDGLRLAVERGEKALIHWKGVLRETNEDLAASQAENERLKRELNDARWAVKTWREQAEASKQPINFFPKALR